MKFFIKKSWIPLK